jgi:fructose-1,6-bisphosphatase/inositol monophosphatase family enzyme
MNSISPPSSRQQLLALVSLRIRECVIEAARYLDQAARSGEAPTVEVKADNTLVMNLDLESQRIIMERLSGSYPIVAEEDPASHSRIADTESYFLVDPLDGTTSCKRFLGQLGGQVGYGPLVGFVLDGELAIAAFYSMPHRQLFTAVDGQGASVTTFGDTWNVVEAERKLIVPPCSDLKQAGMLFFISQCGEAPVVEFLRRKNAVENIYRFGGFASDCARIAQGFEQIQLQCTVKPWDFAAVLLAFEAGCEIFCDPLNRRIPLKQWRIEPNNPILALPKGRSHEFFALLDTMSQE